MKRTLRWLGAGLLVVATFAALVWLFSRHLGGGEVFPEYSSLRADALGTRAFYEALEELSGFSVERELQPLERMRTSPRLVVIAGQPWEAWQRQPEDRLNVLRAIANAGGTVLVAFRAEEHAEFLASRESPAARNKAANQRKQEDEKRRAAARSGRKETNPIRDLADAWELELKIRAHYPPRGTATPSPEAAGAGLPAELAWHSDVLFKPKEQSAWRVIYRRQGDPVVVERSIGRGRIVLMSDSYFLSNEAMHKERATALLTWLIGDQRRATFVESSLGVRQQTGVGHLARRYGLGGAMALLALLGGLYLWQRAVAFLPVVEEDGPAGAVGLRHEPAAGMTALLRRSLDRAGLLAACVQQWREARRGQAANAAALARLEAAWQQRAPGASPVETYNSLVRALKPR